MDFITELNMWYELLVIIDHLTRLAQFIQCKSTITAKETAELFLKEIVRLHRVPRIIVSDRDPQFTSLVFYDVFWPACAGVRGVRIQKIILNNPQIFKDCAHASCARMQGLRARLRTPCWPARAFEDYARGWSIL